MKEEIKKIKGNLLLISNDEELIILSQKNKNITESYVLSSLSKKNKGKVVSQKIHSKKVKIRK